jgi:hypothetical protein
MILISCHIMIYYDPYCCYYLVANYPRIVYVALFTIAVLLVDDPLGFQAIWSGEPERPIK